MRKSHFEVVAVLARRSVVGVTLGAVIAVLGASIGCADDGGDEKRSAALAGEASEAPTASQRVLTSAARQKRCVKHSRTKAQKRRCKRRPPKPPVASEGPAAPQKDASPPSAPAHRVYFGANGSLVITPDEGTAPLNVTGSENFRGCTQWLRASWGYYFWCHVEVFSGSGGYHNRFHYYYYGSDGRNYHWYYQRCWNVCEAPTYNTFPIS